MEAIKEVRENFAVLSNNALTNARQVSSVESWKKTLESYLLEAVELFK